MIYGHTQPAGVSFSLSGSVSPGPAFETDVRLANAQPSEQTAISGAGSSSPDVSEYVEIIADWQAPQAIGAIMLLNLSCPAGTRIEVYGRRLADADYTRPMGGNSIGNAVTLPDGRTQRLIVTSATDTDYIGLSVLIYNDANGVPWADDTTDLLIGEIAIHATTKLCDSPRRTSDRSQRRVTERAANAALHIAPRGEYRSMSVNIHGTITEAYNSGLPGGLDLDKLRAMQDGKRYRASIFTRGIGEDGALDDDLIQRTAIFSYVKWGKVSEEEAYRRFTATLDAEEAP